MGVVGGGHQGGQDAEGVGFGCGGMPCHQGEPAAKGVGAQLPPTSPPVSASSAVLWPEHTTTNAKPKGLLCLTNK